MCSWNTKILPAIWTHLTIRVRQYEQTWYEFHSIWDRDAQKTVYRIFVCSYTEQLPQVALTKTTKTPDRHPGWSLQARFPILPSKKPDMTYDPAEPSHNACAQSILDIETPPQPRKPDRQPCYSTSNTLCLPTRVFYLRAYISLYQAVQDLVFLALVLQLSSSCRHHLAFAYPSPVPFL